MIKNVVKDIKKLSIKSVDADINDLYIVDDLIDTLSNNRDKCIGMAANMIGYNKNIICVCIGMMIIPMINPKIISKKYPYTTEEGCLSLLGLRPCLRYKEITIEYYDTKFNKKVSTYTDLTAEIIEHEIDHLNGIII